MMGRGQLITLKQPIVILRPECELSTKDEFMLEHIYQTRNYTVLRHSKEHIYVNPEMKNSKRLKVIIEEVFKHDYFNNKAEKLFDEFLEIAGKEATCILRSIFIDFKKDVDKLELNKYAYSIIKQSRSKRLYYKARKNRELTKELFDIGFGIYDKEAKCDYHQGIENVFMYGYLLGMQDNK